MNRGTLARRKENGDAALFKGMTTPDPERACEFCRILRGEIETAAVLEDDTCFAFLDRRPLFPGHCLLIPRRHVETLAGLPVALVRPLFLDVRLLSRVVEEALGADGTFVAINNRVSQSVPHLHVHVVPRRRKDGLKGFFWPRRPYSRPEEMREVQRLLREAVQRVRSEEEESGD